MDFVAVVDQVIALLHQRGRVTYRTLQLQFQLDEVYLEALKDDLIYGQRLAMDEEGRVLVWTGGAATPSPAPPALPPPGMREAAGPQMVPPPATAAIADAERRQLTVLFCDLVESTALASRLDPEDLREIVRAYQGTCAQVIARFEGHIAQYLGDGLLTYFGYPLAHEDDAQRAVRAGLGMVEAVGHLNRRLAQEWGVHLAVRLGIHTGLVVVGEVGGGTRQEQLALGETPNIAARLQGLAAPDTVVISEATWRVIQGYLLVQELGPQTLRGVATPLWAYRVLGESGAQSRLDIAATKGLTPLVGREHEVGVLVARWAQVQEGRGHVIVLTGEAGIGKSRLVQVLKDRVAEMVHTRIECRCTPHAQHSAFYPLITYLEQVCAFTRDDVADDKLHKLEGALAQRACSLPEWVPLFATLLSLPPSASYPPLTLTPQRQRQQTLEASLNL